MDSDDTGAPLLKYRVPHGSQPRPGWAPDPPMVGIRSPIGLVVGSCTSHPGVLGSIPKREEPEKTGAPCVKVPGSSRAPLARPVCPFVCVSAASFPCRFPDERTPIEATPLSMTSTELGLGWGLGLGLDSLSRALLLLATLLSHTIPFLRVHWCVVLGSSYLIAHVLHYPPPPTRTAL